LARFSGNQKLTSVSWEAAYQWEPTTGKVLSGHALSAQPSGHQFVDLAQGGRLFVSREGRKGLGILDIPTGKEAWLPFVGKDGLGDFVFTPDGKRTAFVDREFKKDHWVRVWDLVRNKEVRNFRTRQSTCLAISPDGKRVAHGLKDPLILVREVATGKELHRLHCGDWVARELAFSPDGALLAAACSDKALRLWDVNSGTELHRLSDANSG